MFRLNAPAHGIQVPEYARQAIGLADQFGGYLFAQVLVRRIHPVFHRLIIASEDGKQ